MNIHRKLLESAAHALALVLRFEHPADAVLTHYFRQHQALGRQERSFIADAIFGVLRHKFALDHVTANGSPRVLLLAWLTRIDGRGEQELAPLLTAHERDEVAFMTAVSLDALTPAAQAELPDWVYERLRARLNEEEILRLGRALQDPAPLDLRVNTMRTDRASVLRSLAESGFEASPTPHSPIGVRLAGKPAISGLSLFLEGAVEVQDEGSQLIGFLMSPRRHELLVDFCAGAGGKALMLGAMMHSRGRVYAFDVSPARLSGLKPRLKRSGLSNLHPHLLKSEHDSKVQRLAGKIDRVLVDAPCSGFGTLRRNPHLKWQQSPESVIEMRAKQASILAAASDLVKPGGRLVYATCSLLTEESEEIADAFLAEHSEFSPLDATTLLQQHGIALATGERLRLWPHVHGTDGFFAAVFERSRLSARTGYER